MSCKLIANPPDAVEGFTHLDRYLLIGENLELDLDHDAPFYPPTRVQTTRDAKRMKGRNDGRSYIDTLMLQLYKYSYITAAILMRYPPAKLTMRTSWWRIKISCDKEKAFASRQLPQLPKGEGHSLTKTTITLKKAQHMP